MKTSPPAALAAIGLAAALAAAWAVPSAVAQGPAPAPATSKSLATVTRVVDGDTIVTTRGTIRIVGIDTPERGQCGFGPATSQARRLAPVGSTVRLTKAPGKDTDRYGRSLRYVSRNGTDFGGAQIRAGLADARYDSRDGYGWHPKQATYVRWDAQYPDRYSYPNCPEQAAPRTAGPAPAPAGAYYANCTAARLAGAAPVRVGGPGYGRHLDRDGDGVGCE